MLCDTCLNIYDGSEKKEHGVLRNVWAHHDSVHDIEAAGRSGCYICATIWDRLTEDDIARINGTLKDDVQPFNRFRPRNHREVIAEYCFYGWTVYDRGGGVVVFTFGLKPWKHVAFELLPCTGNIEPIPSVQTRLISIRLPSRNSQSRWPDLA
jgi:hypothetical protein